MVGWFKMPLVKEVGTHATLCYRWGPSGDPAPTAAPSHFTAHLYSGQTVAHRSNCWALVLSIAISVSAFIFTFLANVNSRSRWLYICCRPSVCLLSSVVCYVCAPYSGDLNFRQFFYGIWYLGHPLTSTENFTEIVSGEPLYVSWELNTRRIAKYSDFGPIEGYISETVQDRK